MDRGRPGGAARCGLRYELVDGTLLVSAAPSELHHRALGNLYVLLRAACPDDLEVFLAPTDHQPDPHPLLAARRPGGRAQRPGPAAVTTPLALGVEVVSPSSRSIDRLLKRELYEQAGVEQAGVEQAGVEQAGVEQYWVVDPEEPSITVWRRGPEGFDAPQTVAGSEPLELSGPFVVSVVPLALLR